MTVITPQFLRDLLDAHAIGADATGGAGRMADRSLDHDHSEVMIQGVYDLSEVARELSTLDDGERPSERRPIALYAIIAVLMVIIAGMALTGHPTR